MKVKNENDFRINTKKEYQSIYSIPPDEDKDEIDYIVSELPFSDFWDTFEGNIVSAALESCGIDLISVMNTPFVSKFATSLLQNPRFLSFDLDEDEQADETILTSRFWMFVIVKYFSEIINLYSSSRHEILAKLDNIVHSSKVTEKRTPIKTIEEITPSDDVSIESTDEISDLKSRIKELENEKANLYSLYSEQKDRAEKQIAISNESKDELAALRKYVYHLSEEDEEIANFDLSEAESMIAKKNIVIVGGHLNWTTK